MTRIAITMPKLGHDMEAGVVAAWLRNVGEPVHRGEAIAEIQTEKVTLEIEALASGILVERVAPSGSPLPVGAVIGYMETEPI